MDIKVMERQTEIGVCTVTDDGLYWRLECSCIPKSHRIMGLFGQGVCLGIPERVGDFCSLRRRISKSSVPGFTPRSGHFLLLPRKRETVRVCGWDLEGYVERNEESAVLRIPFDERALHPCMPLICYFRYDDGFWRLDLDRDGLPFFTDRDRGNHSLIRKAENPQAVKGKDRLNWRTEIPE